MLNNLCTASWKHQKKILKTTEPLLQEFGISYFGVQTISSDGKWHLLTNNPVWVEHCANEKFYLHDPSLIQPECYKAGFSFISAHRNIDFRSTLLKSATEKFNMDHCLAIIDKNNGSGEFAFFATSCNNINIINTYVGQYKLLQRFVNYFKIEHQCAIQESNEYAIDLKKLKPQSYYAKNNILDCVSKKMDHHLDSMIYSLSRREQQCLSLLLEGKTTKEIAKHLTLSHRTIEEYIANLKEKAGCRYLHDLFVLFQDRL